MSKIAAFILTVQKSVTKVKREVDNEFTKSKYADLEGVLDILNPFFAEHSVLVDQAPVYELNSWCLKTTFKLENEEQFWLFPLLGYDSKTPMQSFASAVTYARRYTLKGIFKLVDSDDDANAVTPEGTPSKPARKSDIEKMLRAFAALNASKGDVESIIQADVENFTAKDLESLVAVYQNLKSGKKKLSDYVTQGEPKWQD